MSWHNKEKPGQLNVAGLFFLLTMIFQNGKVKIRRGARVVEWGTLLRCCTFGYRGFESRPLRIVINLNIFNGEVRKRLNRAVLKTAVAAMSPWVRIPPSPPNKNKQ